jgi:hypothetical protein
MLCEQVSSGVARGGRGGSCPGRRLRGGAKKVKKLLFLSFLHVNFFFGVPFKWVGAPKRCSGIIFLNTSKYNRARRANPPPPRSSGVFGPTCTLFNRIVEGGGAKMYTLPPGAEYPRYATAEEARLGRRDWRGIWRSVVWWKRWLMTKWCGGGAFIGTVQPVLRRSRAWKTDVKTMMMMMMMMMITKKFHHYRFMLNNLIITHNSLLRSMPVTQINYHVRNFS